MASRHASSPLALALGLAVAAASRAAVAQTGTDAPIPPGQPPVSQPSTTSALPEQTAAPAPGKFQRFDELSLKGWDIPFPKTMDTIGADHGGVRSWLADRGIGVMAISNTTLQYDTLQNDGGYRGKQLYNGQKLTRTSTASSIFLNYDLGELGLNGGQIHMTIFNQSNSLNAINGPNDTRIARFNYYQELFGNKVQIKLGIIDNGYEFFGTAVAGSLASGNLGPQATIPYQVGTSYGGFGAPGVNIRFNFKDHFYAKTGFQRSLKPGGATAEKAVNETGFAFAPQGTKPLFIQEFGYNRPSSKDDKSMWVRVGGVYNTTRYKRWVDGRGVQNWAAFAAVDRQITQIDPDKPFRGLYAGATVNYAPPEQNAVTQYYEGRVYGIGLIGGRPSDLASLVTSWTGYSKAGLEARTAPDQGNYKGTFSAVASYAYRLMPGLYLQPGLGVVVHPIYSPRFGTALNTYLTISTLF